MPAVRFFSLLQSGRKIEGKRRAWETVVQCDVASISLGDSKYYQEMRKHYEAVAAGHYERMKKDRVLDAADPATGALLTDLFEQAQRLRST
jgi:hypothetical protein